MIVKFPRETAVLRRLGLAHPARRAAIDKEIREIDAALTALKSRRRLLVSEYQREIEMIVRGSGVAVLACGLSIAQSCPLASFRKLFTIVSTSLF